MESDCWGMIGEYDPSLNSYELSEHEYVEYKGKIYYPIINPNAECAGTGKEYQIP